MCDLKERLSQSWKTGSKGARCAPARPFKNDGCRLPKVGAAGFAIDDTTQ